MSFESFRRGAKRGYGTAAMKDSIVRKGVGAIGKSLLGNLNVGDAVSGAKKLFGKDKGGTSEVDQSSIDAAKARGTEAGKKDAERLWTEASAEFSPTAQTENFIGKEFDKESQEDKDDVKTGDIKEGTGTALSFMENFTQNNPLTTDYRFQPAVGGISKQLGLTSGVSLGPKT